MSWLTIRLEWERTTSATPEATWELLHDTDRFSQVVQSGNRMGRELIDGRYRTVGTSKMGGKLARWIEPAFDFEKPHWLLIERHMDAGPIRVYRTELTLEQRPEGTRVRYSMDFVPRHIFAWLALQYFARFKVAPYVGSKIDEAARLLEGSTAPGLFLPKVPALDGQADLRLAERASQVAAPFDDLLSDWVQHAPLSDQERLMPLRQARVWGTDPDATVAACLEAVSAGVLVLQWELLCPNCRGAESVVGTLPDGPTQVHCGSCNIRYDGSFLDSVGITWSTAPELRDLPRITHCAMSPSNTPHVVARTGTHPGRATVWSLTLPAGSYRIEADGHRGAATLEVRDDHPADLGRFDLTHQGMQPPRVTVGTGPISLTVRSQVDVPDRVFIQDRAWPSTTLTAARFLERPGARDLLPRTAIAPGVPIEVHQGYAIAVDILRGGVADEVAAVFERHEPRRVQSGQHRAVASWGLAGPATSALVDLADLNGISAALTHGPVLEVGASGLGGSAVHRASELARLGGAGRVLIQHAALDSGSVRQFLADRDVYTERFMRGVDRVPGRPRSVAERELPPEGTRIGRFVLQTPLARGGFGAVFAAHDAETGEAAALKLLHPQRAGDPDYVELFYEEARLLASLHHPNLVRVLDWGFSADGLLFLAMERLFGESFAEEIGRGPVAVDRAIAVALDVLGALDAAHGAGVVHCDVKSANVVIHVVSGGETSHLGPRERATLVDFGIASPLAARFKFNPKRSNAFMAPEVEDSEALDHRADIYGVGAMLLHAVTGSTPDAPAWTNASEGLRAIIERAIAEEPSARFDDATAMMGALRALP